MPLHGAFLAAAWRLFIRIRKQFFSAFAWRVWARFFAAIFPLRA